MFITFCDNDWLARVQWGEMSLLALVVGVLIPYENKMLTHPTSLLPSSTHFSLYYWTSPFSKEHFCKVCQAVCNLVWSCVTRLVHFLEVCWSLAGVSLSNRQFCSLLTELWTSGCWQTYAIGSDSVGLFKVRAVLCVRIQLLRGKMLLCKVSCHTALSISRRTVDGFL